VAGKVRSIKASAGAGKGPRYLPEELAGLYKPVKKPITLRLDADILAWFQRGGRGYQTRINGALRKVMMSERQQRD
jgi:uncharacterized protein (DUF4415 family)